MSPLNEVLQNCSEGDKLVCNKVRPLNTTYLTENKIYEVTVDDYGDLCSIDDDGDTLLNASSSFVKVPSRKSRPVKAAQPTQSNDKPKSVVDGDYSAHDTWGIGNKPHKKVKQWKPDMIREDIDIMESIRHACNRT